MFQGIGAGLVLFCQMAAGAPEQSDVPPKPVTAGEIRAETRTEKASVPVVSEATVLFRNEVGDKFQLIGARFILDGIELPAAPLDGTAGKETVIFKGPMTSGRHVITSHVSFQGRNRAIFTYLQGYTLNLDSSDEVFVVSGDQSSATVVAKEQKGFNVPYEKSLTVDFEMRGALTASSGRGASALRQVSR